MMILFSKEMLLIMLLMPDRVDSESQCMNKTKPPNLAVGRFNINVEIQTLKNIAK